MKKYINLTTVLISILIILLFVSLFPFGTRNYKINKGTIKIPRFSYNTINKKNKLEFISFRDYYVLKKEKNNILKDYQKITQNKKTYYLDKQQDIVIKKYSIKKGFIANKIVIIYE